MAEDKFLVTVPLNLHTKTLYAQVFIAARNLGLPRENLVDELNRLGADLKKSTVARWVGHTLATGTAEKVGKVTGKLSALSDFQQRVLIGWVLHQNLLKEKVARRDCAKLLFEAFHLKLDHTTIGRYLQLGGIVKKKQRTKGPGYKLSVIQQCELYLDFIRDIRNNLYFNFPADHIACIDFTFTSHRTVGQYGFSARGAGQPQVNTAFSPYTNCIITCLWADGRNHTPSMMFTYNPEFNWRRSATKKRLPKMEYLGELYKSYNIHYKRVVYMGGKHNTKKYCTESIDLLKLFFDRWGLMDGSVVFRDGGTSMTEGLAQFGFGHDVILPSAIHQYLSVNDNDIHGYVKQQWRQSKDLDFTNDMDSSLRLMNMLDNIPEEHIRHRFDVNFMLSVNKPSQDDVRRVMGKREGKLTKWHDACLLEYRVFEGIDARGEEPDPENPLWNGLDGQYWASQK